MSGVVQVPVGEIQNTQDFSAQGPTYMDDIEAPLSKNLPQNTAENDGHGACVSYLTLGCDFSLPQSISISSTMQILSNRGTHGAHSDCVISRLNCRWRLVAQRSSPVSRMLNYLVSLGAAPASAPSTEFS